MPKESSLLITIVKEPRYLMVPGLFGLKDD